MRDVAILAKIVQIAGACLSLLAFFMIKATNVFLFFSTLSVISILLSFIPLKERIIHNLEYISAFSLILSCLGIFLNQFFIPFIYFCLGLIVIAGTVRRHENIVYSDDLLIVILSILGFWIIYLKFMNLGNIGFLLALNAALLVGSLSHALLEEEGYEFRPVNIQIKPDFYQISIQTTVNLTVFYLIAFLLRDRVDIFQRINMNVFAMIILFFMTVSIFFYFLSPKELRGK